MEVHAPYLVGARHGDVKLAFALQQVPWGVQLGGGAYPFRAAVALLARARYGFQGTGGEIGGAYRVVLGVGYVQGVAAQGHSLRVVEFCLRELAAGEAFVSGAYGLCNHCRRAVGGEIGYQDAVVRRVGDEEAVAKAISEHFAGEEQR